MSTPSDSLDLTPGLLEFFRTEVEHAMQSGEYDVTEDAAAYVATLLADFLRPDARSDEALHESATLLLDEALRAQGEERFERLRSLGDGVLYTSGFFAERLLRRGVHLDYVGAVGARAYQGAAAVLRGRAGAAGVFRELSDKFKQMVLLVSSVADATQTRAVQGDSGLLRLYERWMQGGSPECARQLLQAGLAPVRGRGGMN